MGFWDFVYRRFWWFGQYIVKVYPNLPDMLRKSGFHIYYEAYASFVGFMTVLAAIIASGLMFLDAILLGPIYIIPLLIPVPFILMVILVYLPSIVGGERAGGIEGEIPYATAYLSIMVTSGVSPYVAFERLGRSKAIFMKTSELSQRFSLMVKCLGKDPLTAFSMLARHTSSASVRDLFSGYIATVRAGGDVGDYLTKKARLFFSELLVKIKIIADRLSGLLEAYLALILLTTLSLSTMYFVNMAIPVASLPSLRGSFMGIILYILLPFLSLMIIYMTDLMQYKEPWIDMRPYIFFAGVTIPVSVFLIFFTVVLPKILPPTSPLIDNAFVAGVKLVMTAPNTLSQFIFGSPIDDYLHSSMIITMVLILATIPAAAYEIKVSREYTVIRGITKFLRDLVEVRKTGLSPERSIIDLSRRDYGLFTPFLRKIGMQLSLGVPLSRIVREILNKIVVWRAKVMLYMLTDAIEVGGGTIEILENLAWFAESVDELDDERKKSLRILLVVPYMGAILTVSAIILLAIFMGALTYSVAAYAAAAELTLPAIILNVYLMG
ncbi:MAG: type II secretion system F family protein, partial [Desulfurococcales archaeon]|nr:type II secretion system F family protein [Desulfurococcales archaeon]